jgi:hypothetical protein
MATLNSACLSRSFAIASVFFSTSKSFLQISHSVLTGSLRNESRLEWMTCNCASNRVACTTFLPLLSLDSNRTVPFFSFSEPDSGGAMETASARKLRMLVPNLRSASSAASSAFSISLNRFAASERKRRRTLPASLTMSAGSESGRSGCASGSSFAFSVEAPLSVASGFGARESPAWTERLRACPIRVETPAVAVLLVVAYCLLALS